jgi:hypothetical protein
MSVGRTPAFSGMPIVSLKTFAIADLPPTLKVVSQLLREEATMRTRTREVVRMLATFRHAAHCRRLRAAAAAQAARDLANEESPEEEDPEDGERAESSAGRERRQSGMH